jgi:multiple sugar transport system substrate-binding protein
MNQNLMSRRNFLKLSAGVVSTAALAACAAPVAPAPQQGGAAGSAPATQPVTLSFGHHWEAAFRPVQDDFDRQYREGHPNVQIDITYNTWGDHNQIVPTWAAANTLPDVIYVHGSRAFPWAFENIVVNIQDLVDADEGFNVTGIWDEALNLYRFQGNLHGIPYDHGPLILGYNKDLFDAAGMDYPSEDWTMDDLREAAIALTDLDSDLPTWGWAGTQPGFGNTDHVQALQPWGARLMNEEETQVLINTEEARQAIQFWTDLIVTDGVAPTPAESQAFEQGPWVSGRIAMNQVASWNTPTLARFAPFNWDVAPMPSGPAGRYTSSFGSGFGITRDSNNREAAWQYLSEYLSKEGMETVWGTTGRGSPARSDAYPSWMESDVAPEHAEYFLEALDNYAITGSPYQTLGAAEFNDMTGRHQTLLRSGETTVDAALTAIETEGNRILEEAHARFEARQG